MKHEELLEKIKPRNAKVSDKYSANFYAFVRTHKHYLTVLQHGPSGDLYLTDANWNDPEDNWNCIMGAKVWMILCGQKVGPGAGFTGCWAGVLKKDCEDITASFWPDYIKRGRCVFDPTHDGWLMNGESRFTKFGNNCRCNWCGKWFRKKIKKIVKIERKEIWEEVKR